MKLIWLSILFEICLLAPIITISVILGTGEVLTKTDCRVTNKSYKECSNCSTYELTINVLIVINRGNEIRGKVYSHDQPSSACACDSSSVYPIVMDNLDYYNSLKGISWCYYDYSGKIFYENGKYPVKNTMTPILTALITLFIGILILSIIRLRKQRKMGYEIVTPESNQITV